VSELLLEVSNLSVDYLTEKGTTRAVEQVSFQLAPGEFLGVVGESGCGKSTMLFGVAQLLPDAAQIPGGSVKFMGRELVGISEKEMRKLRWREFAVVMQSAMNALNPMKTIAAQFSDTMRAHGARDKTQILARSEEVFGLVGIDAAHLQSFPHQLSGGMRQRAMIAMALLFNPSLILMDEPTSALDVVAQRSLMTRIKELQRELGFAVVFVTHDMSAVSRFSDRMLVMYAGQVAESAPTKTLFTDPKHPYSRGLMEAFPSVRGPRKELVGIPGSPPNLAESMQGCRFHPRCPDVMPKCLVKVPELYEVGEVRARCLKYDEFPSEVK
jgi:peptide/nickel transport system ATP-binding protein